MKRSLKKYEKYLSVHHYLSVMRRQPAHMRHVYAAVISGTITMFIAAIILYFDYGFWHEKYLRAEAVETIDEMKDTGTSSVTVQSPSEMVGAFFREASEKIKVINLDRPSFLDGKDVYRKEDATGTPEENQE